MAAIIESDERLKQLLKSAIVEVLQERQELVRDIRGDL